MSIYTFYFIKLNGCLKPHILFKLWHTRAAFSFLQQIMPEHIFFSWFETRHSLNESCVMLSLEVVSKDTSAHLSKQLFLLNNNSSSSRHIF